MNHRHLGSVGDQLRDESIQARSIYGLQVETVIVKDWKACRFSLKVTQCDPSQKTGHFRSLPFIYTGHLGASHICIYIYPILRFALNGWAGLRCSCFTNPDRERKEGTVPRCRAGLGPTAA